MIKEKLLVYVKGKVIDVIMGISLIVIIVIFTICKVRLLKNEKTENKLEIKNDNNDK